MVNTAGSPACPSDILQEGFRLADGLRRSDVEPEPLMNCTEAAARFDRPVPEYVRRERSLRCVLKQRLGHDLDSGEHERSDVRFLTSAKTTRAIHVEITRPAMVL